MDPDRARIQADLAGQIDGQVRCDDLFLQMYASDASIYQIRPIGVVRPTHVEDVVACVKYAAENDLAIIPRGSGSNVVGSCLGKGLILDFSYSMRRLESVDRETVTVQPGLVLADLNQELRDHGRSFSADPPTRSFTTIGGLLARNSSGSHWAKNGSPAEKVVSLEMVMADGERVKFESPRYQQLTASSISTPDVWNQSKGIELQRKLGRVLESNRSALERGKPKTKINQAGFNLFDVEYQGSIDVTRLICGSEGALGVITKATLLTDTPARHRGVSLLFFHRLESAAQAAIEITKMGVVACDLLDRRLLSLARETHQSYSRLIPPDAEAMLLVEFQAKEDSEVRDKLAHLQQRIQRKKKLAFDVRITTQPDERDQFWRLTRRVIPSLYRLKGVTRALPFVEDIAIPPEILPQFIQHVHTLLNEFELTASIFAHAPQGLIHVRPFLNMTDQNDLRKMSMFGVALFEHIVEVGGTISASNGDGLSRSWFLRRQYGDLFNVFSAVKDAFDPRNLMNPGKIVGHPYSGMTDNLRPLVPLTKLIATDIPDLTDVDEAEPKKDVSREPNRKNKSSKNRDPQTNNPAAKNPETENAPTAKSKRQSANTPLPLFEPQLAWSVPQMALAARNCNGCGRCRTSSSFERMCPVFRLAPREEASPRAKANLFRGILTGSLDIQNLTQEEFKGVADLCIHCHQCRLECPAGVDIPKLMVEAKAQYFAVNGQRFSDWFLTRLDWLYGMTGRFPRVTNRVIRSPLMRWVLDRLFGLAQGRKLPTFAGRNFLRWAAREKYNIPPKQTTKKVVYFVDAYANWNDVELGQAFVEVLKHNNVGVLIPTEQGLSGISMISDGAIASARKLASRNVEWLAEWVRQGYQIVTTEPSAALALKHEYLNLLDDADARLVAENTRDCSNYLLDLHHNGTLELNFSPVDATVGYHLPCHQRALSNEIPALELLRLIPGLRVEMIEKGCSGMAGTYGLKRKNYNRSLRMGLPLITAMRQPNIMAGTTECSACKIQMEQGTTKPTIHPVKILAMAYGKMPELNDLFNRRSEEFVVS